MPAAPCCSPATCATAALTPISRNASSPRRRVLEPDDRLLLEEVFGCPVFNRYGCREVSVIASECPAHSGLHVMAEGLYLEIETPRRPGAPAKSARSW